MACIKYKEIVSYAKKRKIIVIEDCAQSLGSSVNKKKTGSTYFIIFSFNKYYNFGRRGHVTNK